MKELKRPKLSLKRKQSILSGPSETSTNTDSINTSKSKTHTFAKGESSNRVSVVNTSCSSSSVCIQSNNGLKSVICISDDEDKNDKPAEKRARHLSGTVMSNDCRKSNEIGTFLVSRSVFLNVDNQDLRKLRESFLNHRNIKAVDINMIKSLRVLPFYQVSKTDDSSNNNGIQNSFNNEKSNSNENQNGLTNKNVAKIEDRCINPHDMSRDDITNVHSLSSLPPLCKWCRNRKPVSLHEQYPYKNFWNFDENLPRNGSPMFDKSKFTDKLMKSEESQKTKKTEIVSCEMETSRLNADCNDVKSSFKRQPLFKNSKNVSTSNCTNVAEKMDVPTHSIKNKVVPQMSNRRQIQESSEDIIKQKNMSTKKSYDVKRHDSNSEIGRNLDTRQNMENIGDPRRETESAYFKGSKKDQVKMLRSSEEITKPDFDNKKCSDICNHNSNLGDDDDNNKDKDKMNCNVSNDKKTEKDKSSEIETCPLCQTVFAKGMNQIDKDGHIAACFASSSDDVSW